MIGSVLLLVSGRVFRESGKRPLNQPVIMSNHTHSAFLMHVPTRLLFGAGQLENLHAEALPGRKAMIVISNGKSTRANGYLDHLTGQLDKAGIACAVFDRVEPNPLNSTVNAGGRFAREHGCDFIIALGGGRAAWTPPSPSR